MPRLTSHSTILMAFLSLAGCGGSGPPWKKLPSSSDQPYEVSIRTFKDGAYADQPFHVRVVSKGTKVSEITLMRASQCKNVKILQRPDFLFIFYDELGLNSFLSSQFNASMPRPFLCPLQHEFCRNTLKAAVNGREAVSAICTHS